MCKLMAKVGCIFANSFVNPHLGEGKINDVMMDDVTMNDVMIAATLHWLLLAMWSANHLSNSLVIGKSENQTLPKKLETRFMNEMEHFGRSDRFEVSGIQDGIHARLGLHHMSLFGRYRHQLFTISFHESPWFQFLAGALKYIESAI